MDLLDIDVRRDSGWVVVGARGPVDVATSPRLHQELEAVAARGEHRVVLDLGEVVHLDSFGLGVVAGAIHRARRGGGTLAMVVTSQRILEMLELTGMRTVVPVHRSVAAAVAADGED